ncbi:hypothetical protein TNCV_4696951 [Trichonephila clavipes]|nr:hypothetical protein TNCV_4696951 [Trichonephila clavipes]
MQVTVRFFLVPPQFKGRKPWEWPEPPISLPLPPTSLEDLWLDGCLKYPYAAKKFTPSLVVPSRCGSRLKDGLGYHGDVTSFSLRSPSKAKLNQMGEWFPPHLSTSVAALHSKWTAVYFYVISTNYTFSTNSDEWR